MRTIQYSDELLIEFDLLCRDFGYFMGAGMFGLSENRIGNAKTHLDELTKYSLENNKKNNFTDMFEKPILNHREKNKEKMMKNFSTIITFFYNYLNYATPRLEQYRPDLYHDRFIGLWKHHDTFYRKWVY